MRQFYKKHIILFILNFLIFVTLCLLLDFLIGSIMGKYYFAQTSGLQYRTTYSLEKTQADVLVFGSSRAIHHYEPTIFERNLDETFYNVGRDGTSIFYHYAILKGVLSRYKPKLVLLDILNDELNFNQYSYDRLSELMPYYKKHPEIREVVDLRGPFESFKNMSYIYPYNSSLLRIIIGNTEFNKTRFNEYKGYVPFYTRSATNIDSAERSLTGELDSNKINIYTSFIKQCVLSNIPLYIIVSPYLIKKKQKNSIIAAKNIAREYNVPFLDFSEDTAFLSKATYFYDASHLNDSGARMFSKIVARKLSDLN